MGLNARSIETFLKDAVEVDLHAKTVLSVSMAAVGVLHALSLCIHVVGRALAWAHGNDPKHAIKQVDRLLSNAKVSIGGLARPWAEFLIGERKEILVALDWTDFDADDHTTLCAYLVTRHGRATPLLWETAEKSALKRRRNAFETKFLERLREAIPTDVQVTILADRGFGDQKRYEQLRSIGFHYAIRFRQGIKVGNQFGEQKTAREWLLPSGRARLLKDMAVTNDFYIVPAVVLVWDKRMKEPWCIATDRAELTAAQVTKLYGRRFTIEETFRDAKDIHFGLGLSATHIGDAGRRDRLLLVAAIAHVLLTLLGAAGERAGLDRTLKANTTKKRTLSLYNQGFYWYMAIPNMREERLVLLMQAYAEVIHEQAFFRELLGTI
jgi:hypothetical protein